MLSPLLEAVAYRPVRVCHEPAGLADLAAGDLPACRLAKRDSIFIRASASGCIDAVPLRGLCGLNIK